MHDAHCIHYIKRFCPGGCVHLMDECKFSGSWEDFSGQSQLIQSGPGVLPYGMSQLALCFLSSHNVLSELYYKYESFWPIPELPVVWRLYQAVQ